jgi:hypothetical protein
MKNLSLPFGISEITGTGFWAVKMTAKISNADREELKSRFHNLIVAEVPSKDGGEPTTHKFTMVCTYHEVWKFYDSLKLAIIERKLEDLRDARNKIKNKYATVPVDDDGRRRYEEMEDIFSDELPW